MGVRISVIEAWTNATVGLAASWVVTLYALPLWGLEPTAGQAGGITAFYFGVSFLRALAIREAFRKWAS